MFICMPKKQFDSSLPSWDITFYRIQQSDWLRAYLLITLEPEIYHVRSLQWNVSNHMFRYFLEEIMTQKVLKIQKTSFDPFCPFSEKTSFYQYLL